MLSERFMEDLVQPDGLLNPILARVKKDQTLMIAIRKNYINIYYRGGNLIRVTEQSAGSYRVFFEEQYNKSGQPGPILPASLHIQEDARHWVAAFSIYKNLMDEFFCIHPKPEREFQQLVARENNHSTISNESEYFVSDIEFADSSLGARFDMLAIRWSASQRTNGSRCRAVLVEMKYGDGALDGNAGLIKHLQDMEALIKDGSRYIKLLQTMEAQFNQLDQLGLLKFNQSKNGTKIKLDANERPEVVFILANHNPRSSKLKTILSDPEIDVFEQLQCFDLRFYVASFSGYGLHAKCMLPLVEFRKLL
jgi:hypothetical protein